MIYETLEIIIDQITKYLDTKVSDDSTLVLENIARLEDPLTDKLKDKVVVSVLNLEEEVTLKNIPNTHFKNGKTVYKNRPVNLNLFVLFAANRTSYDKALISISNIIEFFQSKKVFNQSNSPFVPTSSLFDDLKEFKFMVELYTPTFEQLNYIWGTLGGKSVPSVLYKISIVQIEADLIRDAGKPITQIAATLKDTKS